MANQRQTIIDALKTLLQTLPQSIQTGVYNWRDLENDPLTADELPAIVFNDGEDTIEELNSIDTHEIRLVINCLNSGVIDADRARNTANTVCQLLAANRTISGTCSDIRRTMVDIFSEQYGDAVVQAKLHYTLLYRTPSGDI